MAQCEFLPHIDDLIHPEEYAADPKGRRIRFRILVEPDALRVVGDAMSPAELEKVLEFLGPAVIGQMLCG